MLMIDGALDVVHSGVGHAATFKNIKPLLGRLGFELVFDDAVKRISVLHT